MDTNKRCECIVDDKVVQRFALDMSEKDAEIARLRRDIAQANEMCQSDALREEVAALKSQLSRQSAELAAEKNARQVHRRP